jgi:hypothetical protein
VTPTEFVNGFRPQAAEVAAGTGLRPEAFLVQWGVETNWGNAINNANNLGNIRCSPTTFCQYANLAEFCAAAVATWHNGEYPEVLAVAGQSLKAQLLAIGNSKWDAGRYNNGGGPGSSLLAAAQQLNLLRGATMKVIGVAGVAEEWITDGMTKRSIHDPGEAGDLLALCDQTSALIIHQSTVDYIPTWTPGGGVEPPEPAEPGEPAEPAEPKTVTGTFTGTIA